MIAAETRTTPPFSTMNTFRRVESQHPLPVVRQGGLRVALYSHDTVGLGHLRRNLLIADSLARSEMQASNLLIAGAHEANFFRLPERSDLFTLPRWRKDDSGNYDSGKLAIPQSDFARLRSASICSALEVFGPELLIVDKVPQGIVGELLPALEMFKRSGRTKLVLGLRDILDAPHAVHQDWLTPGNLRTLDRLFDAVWIYGDRSVYDVQREYRLPDSIAGKMTYTGYLDRAAANRRENSPAIEWIDTLAEGKRLVACMVGGGEDGGPLAAIFSQVHFDDDTVAVLVTGPFMPRATKCNLMAHAAKIPNLHVIDFIHEADLLLKKADRVIAMGGYNTVSSLLALQKQALIVPRVTPRTEQLIRAERLAQLGLIDFLHPEQVTVEALNHWLANSHAGPQPARDLLDMDGLSNVCRLTANLVARSASVAV